MQADHVEAPVERIGDGEFGVERRIAGGGHRLTVQREPDAPGRAPLEYPSPSEAEQPDDLSLPIEPDPDRARS